MRSVLIGSMVAAAALTIGAAPPAPNAVDQDVLRVQVLLDRLGFAPGVVDGRGGQSLKLALRGFQSARGLPQTGEVDAPTRAWLARYGAVKGSRRFVVQAEDLRGDFVGRLPPKAEDQAKMRSLGYANAIEAIAERFHTTPQTIVALNPPGTRLRAGGALVLPNILPASRAYRESISPQWRARLSSFNLDADQPKADHLVVDKSEGALKVYDKAGALVAQFPVTTGSAHDPLPIGSWTIKGASYDPPFHYNPKLFWDVSDGKDKQLLPPGPNGPVGVIWIDLDKPHYGIHGTPHPETIGRAESHGCIRLSNWDAARLSMMIAPGVKARFQS